MCISRGADTGRDQLRAKGSASGSRGRLRNAGSIVYKRPCLIPYSVVAAQCIIRMLYIIPVPLKGPTKHSKIFQLEWEVYCH